MTTIANGPAATPADHDNWQSREDLESEDSETLYRALGWRLGELNRLEAEDAAYRRGMQARGVDGEYWRLSRRCDAVRRQAASVTATIMRLRAELRRWETGHV